MRSIHRSRSEVGSRQKAVGRRNAAYGPKQRTRALDIVCVGNVVVDSVAVYVDTIPDEGSLSLFDRVEMHLGGCANNTSLALARLGLRVGLVAKAGADGLGDYV